MGEFSGPGGRRREQGIRPGDGRTYNVQILSLNGEYHLDTAAAAAWRKNVEMDLIIESLAS